MWPRSTKTWTPCYNRENGGSRSNASLVEKSNFQKITVQARVLFCWYDIYVQRSVASVFSIFEDYNKGTSFCLTRLQTYKKMLIWVLYRSYWVFWTWKRVAEVGPTFVFGALIFSKKRKKIRYFWKVFEKIIQNILVYLL